MPVIVLAVGLVAMVVGAPLPYAYLTDGSEVSINLAPPIVLGAVAVAVGAWLAAGVPRTRWLAAAVALVTIPLTAYMLIASLRSIPGWARMWHGQDGSPGPAGPIIALGVVLVAIATLTRAAGR